MQRFWQIVNLTVHTNALTLSVGLNHFTCQQRDLLWLQLQIAKHAVVHILNLCSPLFVICVRFTLMHQHTFDHTIFLSFACQHHKPFVWVVTVSFQHTHHPRWSMLHIVAYAVGHEALDTDASDSHMYNTHANAVGQCGYKCPTKVVCRSQTCVGTAQRGKCFAPFAHFATTLLIIHGRHQQETRA